MLIDLIRQASELLESSNPNDAALIEVENGLSTYLEALATERAVEQVSIDEIEEAHRLLREIRRERTRRLAEERVSGCSCYSKG